MESTGPDDDDSEDTQFTEAARDAYVAAVSALVAELQRHAEGTAAREGRQREQVAYFESAARLTAAAKAFSDAEFDWCGSSGLALLDVEDDEDDEDWGDDEPEEEAEGIVSVLTRHDFEITDTEALVEAGRAAYLRAWPGDVRDDAEVRVATPADAVGELIHAAGWDIVEDADGLQPLSTFQRIVVTDEVADLSVEAAEALGDVSWPRDD